jgi:flagella basal body P-ring formation protein FlgA
MFMLLMLAMLGSSADVRVPATPSGAITPDPTTVASAIERAVVERMGDVQVLVHEVSTNLAPQDGLIATIEPGSRLGRPIRFILFAGSTRAGSAVARLEVIGQAPRARRALARDEEITAADVDIASIEITNVMLRRMPELSDIVGAHARRDIVAGELLTNALVVIPPAVKSGDEVRVTITMGAVQVSGVGRASGSGQVGDTIRVLLRPSASAGRVTTPSNRRPLRARIVARGAVEISR